MFYLRFLLLFLIAMPGHVFALDPPVAQEVRGAELTRIAQEKVEWLDGRRIFYFDHISFDERFNSKAQEELSKTVASFMGEFLNFREVQVMCTAVRRISRKYFPQAKKAFCDIKDHVLEVTIQP